ncbi:MAG: nitroreductase family deazaflavin-dependent oxidoreductase [bacterium]|nr:nitroreductase family deazaflavin-dependent oxidoreductase [bacterium]MCP5067675.1 nitroreductase family deazaflavin-dependent oxidoreductase [bacterium]
MKIVVIGFGVVVGLFVLLGLAQLGASESGEVLVLETLDAEGQPQETRIWVVDDGGASWVRGGEDSGWVQRVLQNPEVQATRHDEQGPFRAVPVRDPAARDRVNTLMREKYGFADSFIAMSLGDTERAGALPIRLDPR